MEYWSDGFRKVEKRIIDKIHLNREVKKISINNEITLKNNIPLFHRSIIPWPRPACPDIIGAGRSGL